MEFLAMPALMPAATLDLFVSRGETILGNRYILERTDGQRKTFHACNDDEAKEEAKTILGLLGAITPSLFMLVGGKYIRRHGTGEIIYPPARH